MSLHPALLKSRLHIVLFKIITATIFTLNLYWLNDYFLIDHFSFLSLIILTAGILAGFLYKARHKTSVYFLAFSSLVLIVPGNLNDLQIFGQESFFYLLIGGKYQEYSTKFVPFTVSIISLSLSLALLIAQRYSFTHTKEPVLRHLLKIKPKKYVLNFLKNNWAFVVNFIICLYLTVLAFLRFYSFNIPNADLAIFDQAIFNLSNFNEPQSTVRMVHNLFKDHQHFSMVTLVPFYWIGIDNSTALILVQAFLLIFFPVFFLSKAYKNFFTHRPGQLLVLGITLFLALHPFSQFALQSFFHEVYLVPTFASISIFFLSKLYSRKSILYALPYLVFLALWMGSKEDQWIYVLFFHIQMVVWYFLLRFTNKNTIKISLMYIASFLITGVIASFSYQIFIKNYQTLWDYTPYYSQITENLRAFRQTLNFGEIFKDTGFLNTTQNHMLMTGLSFDILTFFFGNFTGMGSYTQRLISNEEAIGSFVATQYGVLAPFFSVLTFMFLSRFLNGIKKTPQNLVPVFLICTVFLGLYSTYQLKLESRINYQNHYFALEPVGTAKNFKESHKERTAFFEALNKVPPEAGLKTMYNLTPFASSREKISYIEPNICKDPENTEWWCDRTRNWEEIGYKFTIYPVKTGSFLCLSLPHFLENCQTQKDFIQDRLDSDNFKKYHENEYFIILEELAENVD